MRTVIITLAALAATTPAGAQVIARGVDGPRIELRSGWDDQVATLTYTDLSTAARTQTSQSAGQSGVGFGGEAGYDARVSTSTVLGVYAGIDGSTAKSCAIDGIGVRQCLKPGRNLYVGVRGGFYFAPSSIVYIKGGYSNGQIRLNQTDPLDATNSFSGSDNLRGFHAGAGAQFGFGGRFYGKVEYVYTDYNGYEVTSGTDKVSLDFSRHQVLAGLGVQF